MTESKSGNGGFSSGWALAVVDVETGLPVIGDDAHFEGILHEAGFVFQGTDGGEPPLALVGLPVEVARDFRQSGWLQVEVEFEGRRWLIDGECEPVL